MEETQQTLSIPSLLAFAVVSFIAIRYFFFSPTTGSPDAWGSSTPPGATAQNRRRTFPAASVDTLVSMFPQLDRRDVEWNLVNNGGSVQATTERVLTGGRLPAAPRNFVPVYDGPASAPSSSPSQTSTQRQRQQQKPTYQDLITRYGLSARVAEAALQSGTTDSGTEGPRTASEELQTSQKQKEKGGWSSSKIDRQALLKKRREDMVLAARRKMEERERSESKGKGRAV